MRLVAVAVVQLVIVSYLVPQAVGSGITWELLVGRGFGGLTPYGTGVVLSTAVIALVTGLGGMRGTTWTQAAQFLFLVAVLLWLTVVAVAHGFSYPDAVARISEEPLRNPVLTDSGWALETVESRVTDGPAAFDRPGARYGALDQFALVVTLMLGTAGLPHVMNRFFTSPTGRAARVTTVWVLGAAGIFYSLAVLLGVAARATIPGAVSQHPWLEELTFEGLLRVPEHALLALGRIYGGRVGLGVIAVGALVAVMSTIAGLLLASAASWGHDLYERHINPRATQRQAVWAGRIAVWVVATLAAGAAIALEPVSLSGVFPSIVATMVTWAFALAGSALTPVLLLTIWWRGTTAAGATAGLAVGSVVAVGMFGVGLATVEGSVRGLLLAPALVGAPIAGVATVLVSLRTALPASLEASWVRLHGTASDRRAERIAQLTLRGLAAREDRP